ncbi:MAG: hypothetical protein M0Z39_01945 [Actinomycetota bacterium]|nr:hypothetical protein [Actinomycetota bacterium]
MNDTRDRRRTAWPNYGQRPAVAAVWSSHGHRSSIPACRPGRRRRPSTPVVVVIDGALALAVAIAAVPIDLAVIGGGVSAWQGPSRSALP